MANLSAAREVTAKNKLAHTVEAGANVTFDRQFDRN